MQNCRIAVRARWNVIAAAASGTRASIRLGVESSGSELMFYLRFWGQIEQLEDPHRRGCMLSRVRNWIGEAREKLAWGGSGRVHRSPLTAVRRPILSPVSIPPLSATHSPKLGLGLEGRAQGQLTARFPSSRGGCSQGEEGREPEKEEGPGARTCAAAMRGRLELLSRARVLFRDGNELSELVCGNDPSSHLEHDSTSSPPSAVVSARTAVATSSGWTWAMGLRTRERVSVACGHGE